MIALRILDSVLAIARLLLEYVRDRQLMQKDQAQEALDAIQQSKDRLAGARAARRRVRSTPYSGLRDDDGHRRD